MHYFHQVDDPYSHLAVQALGFLRERYDVGFRYHLVPPPGAAYQGDADRFPAWALEDARDVSGFYGLEFPADARFPDAGQTLAANGRLVDDLGSESFDHAALETGRRLWSGAGFDNLRPGSAGRAERALAEGEQSRNRWRHYLGAMFWFDGEWYWGVDRLCRLEERLVEEGRSREPSAALCVPRPSEPDVNELDAGDVLLEYFPSLRSPYTAISFRRTMQLVRESGVQLALKPVMPMMMRGVPAPPAKGAYILKDTKREADAFGEKFGQAVDPFGEPVRRAFSLYPWASEQGRGAEYLQCYLDAAFANGIDITTDDGLRQVMERAGLSWQAAEPQLGKDGWQDELERNLKDLNQAGLWGVPSFRISGGLKSGHFSCWGQDRLWRVAVEIADRAR